MFFPHEKLDVYRASIDYNRFVAENCNQLSGNYRHARDQWIRAAQSIPLNIAEGNGRTSPRDRSRFFDIARGSALECAAVQDVLVVSGGLDEERSRSEKALLARIVSMLTKMGGVGASSVAEEVSKYGSAVFDDDYDHDHEVKYCDSEREASPPAPELP